MYEVVPHLGLAGGLGGPPGGAGRAGLGSIGRPWLWLALVSRALQCVGGLECVCGWVRDPTPERSSARPWVEVGLGFLCCLGSSEQNVRPPFDWLCTFGKYPKGPSVRGSWRGGPWLNGGLSWLNGTPGVALGGFRAFSLSWGNRRYSSVLLCALQEWS